MCLSNCRKGIWTFKKTIDFSKNDVYGIFVGLFFKIIIGAIIIDAAILMLRKEHIAFICGSFPAVVFFDNGDTVFIHQEVLLSKTARDSGGNTSYLKHVPLWDFTITITVLISSPL